MSCLENSNWKKLTVAFGALTSVGLLSAAIVSEEDLEANKPKLNVNKSGSSLIINWDTQPEVYYFVEGSPDLSTWIPAKLLKDNAGTGSLSIADMMGSSKGFYRLSLEGDPDSSRLRADDDGDKIINILEADAGMDAFATEDPTDSEPDGIPDYWEQFHFGTLEHDADYIAIAGGLTLAQAFAAGTNPKELDSDGDGISDADELLRDSNPNNRLSPPYDFNKVNHDDDTTTYTWRSDHGTGDFSIQKEQPIRSGNWVDLFSVPYSSLDAPTDGDRYTVTVDSNYNVITQ